MQKIEQKNIKSIFLEIIWKTENNEELTTTTTKNGEFEKSFQKIIGKSKKIQN